MFPPQSGHCIYARKGGMKNSIKSNSNMFSSTATTTGHPGTENHNTQNVHHSISYCFLIIKPNLTHHKNNICWEGPEDSGARSPRIHTDLIPSSCSI